MDKLKEKIKSIESIIADANHAYYELDEPTMSDAIYDGLVKMLLSLLAVHKLPPSKVLTSVGGAPSNLLKKVTHEHRMMSLDNVFNMNELESWMKSTGATEFVCEPKYDGLSLSLIYEGTLQQGITRGNGTIGEDVTSNIVRVNGIPFSIPYKGKLTIRGEVNVLKESLIEYNNIMSKTKGKLLVNERNAAAGMLRRVREKKVSLPLEFFPYTIVGGEHDTQIDMLTDLSDMGFTFPYEYGKGDIEFVKKYVERLQGDRDVLDFIIDGVVIKVNDIEKQKELGSTSRFPKFSIAYKFPPEESVTVLESIDYQVGRMGTVTPVGRVTPIEVGGVVVSNVTLSNPSEILRKGLRVGDSVIMRRAGDVIPEIVKYVEELRPKDSVPYEVLTNCPCCGSKLKYDVKLTCPNPKCTDRVKRQMSHYVKRDAMNIMGLSGKTLGSLVDNEVIVYPGDIWSIEHKDLVKHTHLADKGASKVLEAINTAKNAQLDNYLYAVGIEGLGRSVSKELMNRYGSLDAILNLSLDDLSWLGPITSSTVHYGLTNDPTLSDIYRGIQGGVTLTTPKVITDGIHKDQVYCITGSFNGVSRSVISKELETQGAKMSKSISKRVTGLIVGNKPGSALKKAIKLGIPILSREDDGKLTEVGTNVK